MARAKLAVTSVALALTAATASAQDVSELTAGKMTGWWEATLTQNGKSSTVRGRMVSTEALHDTLLLEDGRKVVLQIGGGKLTSQPGMIDTLGPPAKQLGTADLTIVDRYHLDGEFVQKSHGADVHVKATLKRVPSPPYSAAELAQSDPGAPAATQAIFDQIPGDAYSQYFQYMWWRFGPLNYRGRLDKSARLFVIGSDPGPTECLPWVRRCLIGDSGQRIQGFVKKLGLDKSYVMMNAHAYAFFPSAGQAGAGEKINADPAIVAWRNKCFSAAVGPDLQAIVILGGQAKQAYDHWDKKPNVPAIYLPHPSRFEVDPDSVMIPPYKNAVTKLRKIVTPDDADLVKNTPNYGDEWTEFDFAPIPRRDLPKGAIVNGKFEATPPNVGEDSWTRIIPIHDIAKRPHPDTGDALIVTFPDMSTRRYKVSPAPSGKVTDTPVFTSN